VGRRCPFFVGTRPTVAHNGGVSSDLVVVIEIPGGSRNKYEMDHETGEIFLDRRLITATRYPADYGFFPDTLSEDGDPLDAVVLVAEPTFPGCRIRVRALAAYLMEDGAGRDAKVLCVPVNDPVYGDVTLESIEQQRREIEHFFNIYKELEPGKSSAGEGWVGAEEALELIEDARRRYEQPDVVPQLPQT
jgi:inorganic pyrophosphatase